MGKNDWQDSGDLEFSEEELSELERSRENRSRIAPSGEPRKKTHRGRGLRVPADVVPRKTAPMDVAGTKPAGRPPSSKTLPMMLPVTGAEAPTPTPTPTPRSPEQTQPMPRPEPTSRPPDQTQPLPRPEPPQTQPIPRAVTEPAPTKPSPAPPQPVSGRPPLAPPASAPAPREHAVVAAKLTLGGRPPFEPEEAATNPFMRPMDGLPRPAELDTDRISIDVIEASVQAPKPPETPSSEAVTVDLSAGVAALRAEQTPVETAVPAPPEPDTDEEPELVEEPEPEEATTEPGLDAAPSPAARPPAVPDEAEEGDTVEIAPAVVQKAVQMALEAAIGSATSSPSAALGERDFDLDSPTGPGASRALEELSQQSDTEPGAGADADGERANRVAILLSALRPQSKEPLLPADPAEALAAESPSDDVPGPEEVSLAGPAEVEPEPAAEPAPPAPAAPVEPAPATGPVAEAAGVKRRTTGELEEISGEELEEVHGDTGEHEVPPAPPPIPEAGGLSPFDGDAEPVPPVVRVPVRDPDDDDEILTSAPPEEPAPPVVATGAIAQPPPLPAEPSAPTAPTVPQPAAVAPPPSPVPTPPPMPLPPPVRPEPIGAASAGAAEPRGEMFVPEKAAPTRGRKRKKAWFEEIFDEDWLRTLMPVSGEQTRREVDFLEESLQPSQESQVLDLGCGEGRHAIELAGRGYQLTGYDLSLPLLIRAADEAQRRDIHVNFIHGDFRELSFEEQFDAAYCLHTSFGYFDDDANRKVIQSVNAALRVGGRFLLDVANRDFAIRDLPARIWWEGNGCVVLEEVDFNYFTSRIISKRSVVFEDGRHLEQEISVRSYSLHELGKILHHAGFRVLEVSGHFAHRTRFFGNASRSLMLLAEKRPV